MNVVLRESPGLRGDEQGPGEAADLLGPVELLAGRLAPLRRAGRAGPGMAAVEHRPRDHPRAAYAGLRVRTAGEHGGTGLARFWWAPVDGAPVLGRLPQGQRAPPRLSVRPEVPGVPAIDQGEPVGRAVDQHRRYGVARSKRAQ